MWILVFVMLMLLSGSLFEQYVMIVPLIIVCADIILAPQGQELERVYDE